MSNLLFNLVLGIVWCMLTGSAHPWNFVAGVFVGAVVVSAHARMTGRPPYIRRVFRLVGFGWYFLVILTSANVQIARELITPGFRMRPRVLRYPVGHLTDVQRTALANAITLTPGTLVVDVCPTGSLLYLHCIFAEDGEAALRDVRELEARMVAGVFT